MIPRSADPATLETEPEMATPLHRGCAALIRIIRGGPSIPTAGLAALSLKAIELAMVVLVSSACAASFDRYNMGNAELWIGGQTQVHAECARRGAVTYSNAAKIYGCADFQTGVIISVPDPKIIAHELCHWTSQSGSHDVCPTPTITAPPQ